MKACVHSLGRTAVPGPNGHTGEKLGRGDSRGAYNVKANVRLQLHSILDLGVHPLWKVPCTQAYPMCNNMQVMTIKLRWSRVKTLLLCLPNFRHTVKRSLHARLSVLVHKYTCGVGIYPVSDGLLDCEHVGALGGCVGAGSRVHRSSRGRHLAQLLHGFLVLCAGLVCQRPEADLPQVVVPDVPAIARRDPSAKSCCDKTRGSELSELVLNVPHSTLICQGRLTEHTLVWPAGRLTGASVAAWAAEHVAAFKSHPSPTACLLNRAEEQLLFWELYTRALTKWSAAG